MSTVILDSTDTSYRVSNSNTSVRGATGNQAVLQDAGLTGNTFDANVERIGFSGLTTDYTYRQSGNTIQVFNSSSSTIPVAKIALGSATELLSFANGTVELKLVPAAVFGTAPTITLGGQTVVATTTATPVSAAPVTIPPAILEALVATYPITLPSFSVAAKSTTATEGGEAEFTVTLANPSATTTTNVKYTFTNVGGATNADTNDEVITGTGVTADISTTTAGVDGPYTGTLHFAPGATTATIKLPIAFDLLAEAGEGMSLTLSNPTGAGSILGTSQVVTTTFAEASAATFTMTSNAVAGVATQEGQTITFTVTPTSIVNAPTLLNLQVVGEVLGSYTSTTNAADFGTLSSLTFAAGSTASQQVTILVAADTSPEGTEAYRAQMLDAVGVEKAFVKGIIADALPTLTLSTANATVNEGGIAIYTVTASAAAPAGGLSVPYTLAGTATTVTDYTVPAGNITIAAGATTGTLTLTTLADTLTEAGAAETVIVSLGTTIGANLSTVTGATTATTTITDSSQTPIPGAVTLSSSAATITETAGANVVTYTVTLGSAAPAGGVTIPYTLSGAATLTTDYTGAAATTGNFTIAAGATTGTLVLTAVTDSLTESAAEAITVTLGTLPTGYTLATGTTNTTTTAITDSSQAVAGSSFTLTSGTDARTGTSGNDTFIGDRVNEGGVANVQTLTTNDTLDGGLGTDTLVATLGASVTPAALTSIEVINVNNAAAANLTLTNAPAVTTIKTAGNTNAIVFDGLATLLTGGLEISSNAQNVTVTTTNTTLAGSTDALGVTLRSVTAGTLSIDPSTGTNGYETITVTSTGNVANTLAELNDGTGTSWTKLSVRGDKDLTITNTLPTEVLTVDGVGFTGKLNVTQSGVSQMTITGGDANDTFTLGGTYVGGAATVTTRDVINGGSGTDILSIDKTVAEAIAVAQANLTSIETLSISDGVDASLNLTYFTGVTGLVLAAARTAATATITVNSGSTVTMKVDAGDQDTVFVVTGSGTSDTMTLALDAAVDFAGTTGTAETFTGIETLNIQTASTAGTVNIFADATTMTATAGTEKMVITGATPITFTGVVTADEIDASGLTGTAAVLTLTNGTAASAIIKGGAAADVLTGSANADIIQGNAGADLFTSTAGADALTGGAGSDIFYYDVKTDVGQSIADFTAGTTDGDIFRIDDSGFGTFIGTDTLAFKKIGTGVANAATSDNVVVVTDAAIAGTNAAAVEDGVIAAAGAVGNLAVADIIYVIFNSTTGKGEVWTDAAGGTDNAGTAVTLVATLDNIITLSGIQALVSTNFNVVA